MNLLPDLEPGGHASAAPRALRGAFVILLCAAAGLCLVALSSAAIAQESKPKAPARSPIAAPSVIDLQGLRDLLSRYRGRPLMVNFWATWCEPCRDEYPIVVELARQYAPQGLAVVGISLDEDADIVLVRHFLARNRPGFPNYRKRPGNEEAFINGVDPKWSGAIPATFFHSRDGRQVAHLFGEHTREEFERAIRALLEPDTKTPTQPGTKASSPGH